MRILLTAFFVFGLITACSQSEKKTDTDLSLSEEVNVLIEETKFDQAMQALNDESASAEVTALKEKVHLNHGIHLIYNSDPSVMRENANKALREFIAVLEINPNNQKAIAETEQILTIYRSFPDRKPADDVTEKLKELGFKL